MQNLMIKFTFVGSLLIFSTLAHAAPTKPQVCKVTKLSWGGLLLEFPGERFGGLSAVSGEAQSMGDIIVQAILDGDCNKIEILTDKSNISK